LHHPHHPHLHSPSRPPPHLHSFPTRRSSDLARGRRDALRVRRRLRGGGHDRILRLERRRRDLLHAAHVHLTAPHLLHHLAGGARDRKSTRLNSSHVSISYAVFCLKKKKRANS